jgi:hypothetical protein
MCYLYIIPLVYGVNEVLSFFVIRCPFLISVEARFPPGAHHLAALGILKKLPCRFTAIFGAHLIPCLRKEQRARQAQCNAARTEPPATQTVTPGHRARPTDVFRTLWIYN